MPDFIYKTKTQVLDAIKSQGIAFFEQFFNTYEFKKYLNSFEVMEQALEVDSKIIKFAPVEVARELLATNGQLLKDASEEARKDYICIFNSVKHTPKAYLFANVSQLPEAKLEEISFEAVSGDWEMLGIINVKFRKRLDFVEKALSQNKEAKKFVDEKTLTTNKTLAFKLMNEFNLTLDKYDKGLRKDFEFAQKMIIKDAKNIKHILGKIKKEESLAQLALVRASKEDVKEVYNALPRQMRHNRDNILIYVKKAGTTKGIPFSFKRDADVVRTEVLANGENLKKYRNKKLINNVEILKAGVSQNPYMLKYAKSAGRKNLEVIMTALHAIKYNNALTYKDEKELFKKHPLIFSHKKFRKNAEVMLEAVQGEGLILKLASKQLKNDKTIVKEAVKNNPFAYKYVSDELKKDIGLITLALKLNAEVVDLVDENILKEESNFEHILSTLKVKPDLYNKLPEVVQKRKEAILAVVSHNSDAAKNLQLEDRKDKEFMKEIALLNKEAFDASKSIELEVDKTYIKKINVAYKNKQKKQQIRELAIKNEEQVAEKDNQDENAEEPELLI